MPAGARSRSRRSPARSSDETGSSNQRHRSTSRVALGEPERLLARQRAVRVDEQLDVGADRLARDAAPARGRARARGRPSSSRGGCPSRAQPPSCSASRSSEYDVKPPLPYTGTASRTASSSVASGRPSSRAFRSQSAVSTAAIASEREARPARVAHRTPIAAHARGHRERVVLCDHVDEQLVDQLRRRGRRVRVAEPDLAAAVRLDDDDRRRVPLGRAVRLGLVRRNGVRRDVEPLDGDVGVRSDRHLSAAAGTRGPSA